MKEKKNWQPPPTCWHLEPGMILVPDTIGTTILVTPSTPNDSPSFDDEKESDIVDKETFATNNVCKIHDDTPTEIEKLSEDDPPDTAKCMYA